MSYFWQKRNNKDHVGSNPYKSTAEYAARTTSNFGIRCPVGLWDALKERLTGRADVRYVRYQRERNDENAEGAEHYQVLVIMHGAYDLFSFKGKTGTQDGKGYCVWACKVGETNKEMAEYCWKDDQVVRDEEGQPLDRGEWGQPPVWRSPRGTRAAATGGQSETAKVKALAMTIAADPSIPLALAGDIVERKGLSAAMLAPHTRQLKDGRLLAQQSQRTSPPEDMKVYVFHGAPGSGKSASASYNAQFHYGPEGFAELQAAQGTGKLWMCNIGNQRTLLINDYGHNKYADITVLLNLLDPQHVHKAWETKGGQTRIKFDRIIITSNYPPHEWFPRADAHQKGALMRRITRTVYFTGRMDRMGRKLYDDRGQLVPQIYDIQQDCFIPDGMDRLKAAMKGQDIRDGFVVNEDEDLARLLTSREPVKLDTILNRMCERLGIDTSKFTGVKRTARSMEEEDDDVTPPPTPMPASLPNEQEVPISLLTDTEDEDETETEDEDGEDATELARMPKGTAPLDIPATQRLDSGLIPEEWLRTVGLERTEITSQELEEMRKARLERFKKH